ncbi:MAG TPA: helix-turn-helix domain-containing protein [Gaiellaceae bacterium]|nr:helix-turn-helix domain-containing protein [Gaiellaceae bacterium]
MPGHSGWTFVTSHAVLLLEVNRAPDSTVRELAHRAGLTERQTHRVLSDLVEDKYLERERIGRRNRYRVNKAAPMRHPSVSTQQIGDLLSALGD